MPEFSDEVGRGFDAALATLRQLGTTAEEVSIPTIDAALAMFAISGAAAFEFHENWLRTRAADYGEDVRERLLVASMTSASDYVRAQRARTVMLADAMRALEEHDALLAPVSAIPAPRIGTHPGRPLDDRGEVIDNFSMILRFTMTVRRDRPAFPRIADWAFIERAGARDAGYRETVRRINRDNRRRCLRACSRYADGAETLIVAGPGTTKPDSGRNRD